MNSNQTLVLRKDDRIFLGEGLFETLRVSHAKPCLANLHWQRLKRSALSLGISFAFSLDDWQERLIAQIKEDHLCQGGIKAILSGGCASRGLAEFGQNPQLLLQTFSYTPTMDPLRLKSSSWLREASNPIYQIKSVNYLEAIIAARQAIAHGFDDVLFYNSLLHATETTCANLFLIKEDILYTPPLSDGVLPGITRLRLIEISKQQAIPCLESSLTIKMIEQADAVFVTNSLQGMRLVKSLDDMVFDLTHPLYKLLAKHIKLDLGLI